MKPSSLPARIGALERLRRTRVHHRTALAGVCLSLLGTAAQAETFWVTTLQDRGAGSLREAVEQANANPGPDVVRFKIDGVIELAAPLVVRDDLRVDGGDQRVVISGGGTVSLFVLHESSKSLELARLTLTRAAASSSMGGAVLARGNLRVTDALFTENLAPVGGAIYSAGALLQVVNTSFADNQALSWGGAVAVSPMTQATITHSTFVNNQAAQFGGALFQNPIYPATVPGGLQQAAHVPNTHPVGFIALRNSVLSGVSAQGNCSSISNRIVDEGGNLSSDNSCPFSSSKGSAAATNPLLSTLADNGGPTRSFAPLAGSPLIDSGVDAMSVEPFGATLATDQRGQRRRVGMRVDRGAVEWQPPERVAEASSALLATALPGVMLSPTPEILGAAAALTAPAAGGGQTPTAASKDDAKPDGSADGKAKSKAKKKPKAKTRPDGEADTVVKAKLSGPRTKAGTEAPAAKAAAAVPSAVSVQLTPSATGTAAADTPALKPAATLTAGRNGSP